MVITDYDIDPGWARPEVDRYFVAHEDLAEDLAGLGVERSKIKVSGIPIDRAFEADGAVSLDPRCELGLRVDRPVLLLLGGGLGVGPLEEALRASLRLPEWQIVAVCGRNEKLRQKLIPLAHAHPGRLRLLGYRRDLPFLMRGCDAVVTKGGGLGLTEALHSGKPVVAVAGFPGQETANIGFLASKGWIAVCSSPEEIPAVFGSLPTERVRPPLQAGALKRIAGELVHLAART
ncbi:MAG: glycosyltransferase [Acidobacteriota bacterium]